MGIETGQDRFRRKQLDDQNRKQLGPGEDEAPLPPPVETIRGSKEAPGRNDDCPCGSGKKFKKCCANKES